MRKILGIVADCCVIAGGWSLQHAAFLVAPALGYAVWALLLWVAAAMVLYLLSKGGGVD